MKRLSVALALVILGATATWSIVTFRPEPPTIVNGVPPPIEMDAVVPWRDPSADLKQFFPSATRYQSETRILSGVRLMLAQRLGRPVAPAENSLRLFRIFSSTNLIGNIQTISARGAFGSLEAVLATDAQGHFAGIRFQRSREPQEIQEKLESVSWADVVQNPNNPAEDRLSGNIGGEISTDIRAVTDAIHAALTLHAVADETFSLHSH